MHLYSAFCVLLYTQSAFTIMWGGLTSTTTSVQHPLGWCDGCHRITAPVRSPHTSYRWRGEREIEPIKWKGIITRPWLTRASGGNLARTPGYTLLFTRSAMGFLMTTESQDLGLTSHPKVYPSHQHCDCHWAQCRVWKCADHMAHSSCPEHQSRCRAALILSQRSWRGVFLLGWHHRD